MELYKEIKKNGPSRCVRAALWRFADMCHLIRPQKCRPYIVNLLPCITRLCQRPEEAVQETLATSMAKLCPVLINFANDTEVKVSFFISTSVSTLACVTTQNLKHHPQITSIYSRFFGREETSTLETLKIEYRGLISIKLNNNMKLQF